MIVSKKLGNATKQQRCIIRPPKRTRLLNSTNALSNRYPLNLKIQPIHLDEVAADKPDLLTGLVKDVFWPSPSDEIPFWKRKFHTRDVNPEIPVNIEKDSDISHVIHVIAEIAPIAKFGGLGDVVAHRWDTPMFSDRERQEKFNKLMGVKGDMKVELKPEIQDSSLAEKQKELQSDLEKQGLRRRDGRTVGLGL